MNTTAKEHLAWCKARALEELDVNGVGVAVASIISDLGKHPETEGLFGVGKNLMLLAIAGDTEGLRNWINAMENLA